MPPRQRDTRSATSPRQQEAAEALAASALAFLADDAEEMGRFLSLTGLGPGDLRAAAREPHFLAGVLEHLATDERLLVRFAEHAGVRPAEVDRARFTLGGGDWERDSP